LIAYAVAQPAGTLTEIDSFSVGGGAGFVKVVPATRDVFVSREDEVVALRFDGTSFTEVDRADTSGGGTHVNALADASRVFVAHFNEGEMSVLDFDGSTFSTLRTFTPCVQSHMVFIARGEHVAFVPCRDGNAVAQFDLGPGDAVAAATPATVAAAGGPRHMDQHPTLPIAYVLTEHASDVHVFDLDGAGRLVSPPRQTIATRADAADNWSSDVHLSADATRLYAANRGDPAVAELAVATDGSLTFLGTQPLMGVVRAFAVDPRGPHVYFGDDEGHLQRFEHDPGTGRLVAHETLDDLGSIQVAVLVYLPEP
jgi:6-phosphogluconolactonase (cycloisomerase 2 family)